MEETEGKLQMLLSLRKNGLDSLFKEVRVFKEGSGVLREIGGASGGAPGIAQCGASA